MFTSNICLSAAQGLIVYSEQHAFSKRACAEPV